jgi:hypothetical protein
MRTHAFALGQAKKDATQKHVLAVLAVSLANACVRSDDPDGFYFTLPNLQKQRPGMTELHSYKFDPSMVCAKDECVEFWWLVTAFSTALYYVSASLLSCLESQQCSWVGTFLPMTVSRASVAVAAISCASVIAVLERATLTPWPVRVADLFLIHGCVFHACVPVVWYPSCRWMGHLIAAAQQLSLDSRGAGCWSQGAAAAGLLAPAHRSLQLAGDSVAVH